MKLYTTRYDANAPSRQQINIPTNSNYMVGVKVVKNGRECLLNPDEVKLDGQDAEKTKLDGYVVFNRATGDNASMNDTTLSVDYTPLSAENIVTSITGGTITAAMALSGDSPFIGQEIHIEDIQLAYLQRPKAEGGYTEDEVRAAYAPLFWPPNPNTGVTIHPYEVGIPYQGYTGDVLGCTTGWFDDEVRKSKEMADTWLEAPLPPRGTPYMLTRPTRGGGKWTPITTFTIYDHLYLYSTQSKVRQNAAGLGIKLMLGTPLKTKFKLTENIYKSQEGDKGIAPIGSVLINGLKQNDESFSIEAVTL